MTDRDHIRVWAEYHAPMPAIVRETVAEWYSIWATDPSDSDDQAYLLANRGNMGAFDVFAEIHAQRISAAVTEAELLASFDL